jgi:hypothetical protein
VADGSYQLVDLITDDVERMAERFASSRHSRWAARGLRCFMRRWVRAPTRSLGPRRPPV